MDTRMHGACGVIDTSFTKKFSNNFEKWKSYAKQRWYAKKIKFFINKFMGRKSRDTVPFKAWNFVTFFETTQVKLKNINKIWILLLKSYL
jgi:hypothetical protein